MLRGLPISHFADYDPDPAIGPRPDQGEIYCCMACPYPDDCPINFNVEPRRRRCPLEEYLDDRRREAALDGEYLTASQIARLTGVHVGSVIKRIHRGKYPGARKRGRKWMIPAGVAE